MGISRPGGPGSAGRLIERQVRRWDRIAAALKKGPEKKSLAAISHRPVLTISGMFGGGRERLAVALCKEFEYELYGRELLDAVAADLRCQRMLLESFDERGQSNIRVMLETWLRGREIEHDEYIAALFRVMGSLAEKGGAVILGRCGSYILEERAALRILVMAPFANRLQRVMTGWKISEKEARKLIERRDREQADFARRFFRRELSDPLGFDLTVNTARFEPERLAGLVRGALAQRGIEIQKAPV